MSRKPATGRFQTREELVAEVWQRYLNTPSNVAQIARFARVSETTIHNILNRKERRPCSP